MQKRNLWLTGTLLLMAVVYVIFFTNWFKSKPILIHYTARPSGFALRTRRDLPPNITFGFDIGYKLNEVKVISLADLATNADPIPFWHLTSDSNSIAYDSFKYGQNLRGMHPVVPGARALPLDPKQVYRIFIRSGKRKGQRDFSITPPAAPATPAAADNKS